MATMRGGVLVQDEYDELYEDKPNETTSGLEDKLIKIRRFNVTASGRLIETPVDEEAIVND